MNVSVVIPAFNEEATIGDIVRHIRQVGPYFEILVVDDGSSDRTAERAKEAGATVIRNPYNLGNGASVKSACLKARGDVIVMLDADGQHPPEEIPRLLADIGEYDMCVGARTKFSRTSRFRDFGNFMLNNIASWISGSKVVDLTSGFRAIKRDLLLEYIHLFPTRYSYPTTITMAMLQGNHFVKYVPVDTIQKREQGTSHIRPVHDFLRFVRIMIRLVLLFSPRRFFLPLALVSFLGGLGLAIFQLTRTGAIQSSGILLMLAAVSFFCFGILAEQIAELRRQKNESLRIMRPDR
jgi:glycosyltransferase involved in cell wall biosynthesis